ncbi:MAG: hypothetical protein ACYC3B_02400 [Sedimentisphaerales bacterium]
MTSLKMADKMTKYERTYKTLHQIYDKHRRFHRENGDRKHMSLMWSTYDPPDIIEGTEPFRDVEKAFNIQIDEDEALDLYDMDLEDAARRIIEMQKNKSV